MDGTQTQHKKILRRIDYLLRMLFSPKRIEPIKLPLRDNIGIDWFSKEIRLKGNRMLLLNDAGVRDFRDLVSAVDSLRLFGEQAVYGDIWSAVKEVYQNLLSDGLMPEDGDEFVTMVSSEVRSNITKHTFVVPIGGAVLDGIDELQLGALRLVSPNVDTLSKVGIDVAEKHLAGALESMKRIPWLIGESVGTTEAASRRFQSIAALTIGLLSILASANYKYGATSFRLTVRMTPEAAHGRSTYLRCEEGSLSTHVHYGFSSTQTLRIGAEFVERLGNAGLFDRAFEMIAKEEPDDLERAILTSIYWFADAQQDANPVMQFVKYWTCVETIFAEHGNVVRSVATGLATMLVGGGLDLFAPAEYPTLKRRITALYAARSKALHGGFHLHVSSRDVADMSQWTSWMLIALFALLVRGFTDTARIRSQTERIDGELTRVAAATASD